MGLIRLLIFILFLLIAGGAAFFLKSRRLPSKIRKAEEHLASDELQDASDIVKAVLRDNPDYPPARYLRARVLMKQTQYVLAISELNSLLSLPDFKRYIDESEVHYLLAEMYSITQQYQKEIDEYRIILKFRPDDVLANHRVGHAYFKQLNYADAKTHLLRAITLDNTLADTCLPLGLSFFNLDDYGSAEVYLLKALEVSPEILEPQFYMGLIYKSRKDHEAATKMLENAKRDKRFFLRCNYHLADMFFEQDMYGEAIARLEEGLSSLQGRDDDALAYRYLLAESYERANKISEAVYHWQAIADTNPHFRNVRMKLDDYQTILGNENLKLLFTSSLEEMQPVIVEMIARMNYAIISKRAINANEYSYKAYNIKRMNEQQVLICFLRTIRDITESQLNVFFQRMTDEGCKSGIFMTTSRFTSRAKSTAATMMIELLDESYIVKQIEKISTKKPRSGM